jgi:hypothetical protein
MTDVTEDTPWRCKTCGEIVRDADLYDHIRHHHNPDYDECAESPYRYFEEVSADLAGKPQPESQSTTWGKLVEMCDLFEKFLKTMDDIMGGGDTVVRFRDRYEKLTGKKVFLLGD